MNCELVKLIEEATKELKENFNKTLDDFLGSIDGYNQLSEDSKSICKIFLCMSILYKLENLEVKNE